MSHADENGSVQRSQLITARSDLLADLGAHEGAFQWSDVPDWAQAEIRKLWHSPVLQKVESGGPKDGATYTLNPAARSYLRQHLDERETMLPCGHSGLRNHGHYFECGYDGCVREFYPDEIQEGDD